MVTVFLNGGKEKGFPDGTFVRDHKMYLKVCKRRAGDTGEIETLAGFRHEAVMGYVVGEKSANGAEAAPGTPAV